MHVNYARGETRTFVFRREHGHSSGCCSAFNGKRRSLKGWKKHFNQKHRKQDRQVLKWSPEDPFYKGFRKFEDCRWCAW